MAELSSKASRRDLLISGAAVAVGALSRSVSPLPPVQPLPRPALLPRPDLSPAPLSIRPPAAAPAQPAAARFSVDPRLLQKALAALDRHADVIKAHDRIAIVDFTAPSSEARLHFLDVVSGKACRLLVAHGSGSDPAHTGFLKSFSNAFGSNASSEGAFLTEDYYVGKHGRSQRLVGLDPTNNNALDRAVVIHGAWYANDDMIRAHGKLGRSQGCFAVGENKLGDVFGFLGKGRLVYAARA